MYMPDEAGRTARGRMIEVTDLFEVRRTTAV